MKLFLFLSDLFFQYVFFTRIKATFKKILPVIDSEAFSGTLLDNDRGDNPWWPERIRLELSLTVEGFATVENKLNVACLSLTIKGFQLYR